MPAFTVRQATEIVELLRAAARTEIMPRFRADAAPGSVRTKSGPYDLVTEADEAAEAMIARGLERLFPGAVIVGEEGSARDPSRMAALATAPLAFTIDPIDGTGNFAAGLPLFGTMVAATVAGETVAAVILDPVTDSAAVAVRGEGAFERAAGGAVRDLRVAAPAPLEQMRGAASWRFLPHAQQVAMLPRLARIAQLWDFRCAAHEYRLLAGGHAHFLMFNRLMPWDHLPGALLQQEAGGHVAKFDFSPYRPGETAGGLIAAPDRASFELLRDTFFGPATA